MATDSPLWKKLQVNRPALGKSAASAAWQHCDSTNGMETTRGCATHLLVHPSPVAASIEALRLELPA